MNAANANVGLTHLGVELGKTYEDMDCFAPDFEDFELKLFSTTVTVPVLFLCSLFLLQNWANNVNNK